MTLSKCPYHNKIPIVHADWDSHQDIRSIFQELQSWVHMTIDSPEKEQAIFAYRISQFWDSIADWQRQFWLYTELMRSSPDTYKNLANEMWNHLKKYGKFFFASIENDPLVRDRLIAWLETFHAFVKRAVIFSEKNENNTRVFPYKNAVQFCSTSIERARMMAANPDVNWWEFLFFDSDTDVSKLYLWFPITRPIYRCPVLYSGKFREIIDAYFNILCETWDISTDMPIQVDWNE